MVPGSRVSSTDAVGLELASLNTVSCGMARLTEAFCTPSITLMVLANSPCRPRW